MNPTTPPPGAATLPVGAPATGDPRLRPGLALGPHVLIGPLGEGAFGSVWAAQQTEPVRRRVAVKVLKAGLDSASVLMRFAAERQALAVMDHPGIARVYDAGTTAHGQPYFVMEYVAGAPIAAHCQAHQLSVEARLRLFMQVCEAVEHAHFKGVVHRDLKPSNLLVERDPQTAADRVRVIDFGIAKAIHRPLAAGPETEIGEAMGTLEYMSPEQAGGDGDVDTRADIFALGVVLFELLTGQLPLASESLRSGGLLQALHAVRDSERPTPSRSVAGFGRAPDATPARLRGDLDAIVGKCLARDREQRYGTATALLDDIRRHLAHEPVLAGRAAWLRRCTKFARRHRVAVAALGAVLLAVVAGMAATGLALREAQAQREAARLAAAQAGERLAELERVSAFQERQLGRIDVPGMGRRLRDALEAKGAQAAGAPVDLQAVNFTDLARETLHREVFAASEIAIDAEFADRPELRARLLLSLGSTLVRIGANAEALPILRKALHLRHAALGDGHPETLAARERVGAVLRLLGRYPEAHAELEAALQAYDERGERHSPGGLAVIDGLGAVAIGQAEYARAETLFRESIDARRRLTGQAEPDALPRALMNLATAVRMRGRLEEAEAMLGEAVQFLGAHPAAEPLTVLMAKNRLAETLRQLGKYAQAEPLAREAVTGALAAFGSEHALTLSAQQNLSQVLANQGDARGALELAEQVLAGRTRTFGFDHPNTLATRANHAGLLAKTGALDAAVAEIAAVDASARKVLPAASATLAGIVQTHGEILADAGRLAEAQRALLEARALWQAVEGSAEEIAKLDSVLASLQSQTAR